MAYHVALRRAGEEWSRRGATVMISSSVTDEMVDLYADWERRDAPAIQTMGHARGGSARPEALFVADGFQP